MADTIESPRSPILAAPLKVPMDPINNMCTVLQRVTTTYQGVGTLVDNELAHQRHALYFIGDRMQHGIEPKSLESFFERSAQNQLGFNPSRQDRLFIAATLASSVLQLDGTWWLKKQWKSGDIFFMPIEDQQSATAKIDFSNPYVSWKVSAEPVDNKSVADTDHQDVAKNIPSETLSVLGITLTELCFRQTISQMREIGDVDPSGAELMTNFNTACRLLPSVYTESGERYGDVVRRCLRCPFDIRDISMDNVEFQAAVFDWIVTPLKEDFENFTGKSSIK